ncbi:MAG: DUF427 domain-containing protein [Acidimicrobiia bacterium]
MAIDFESGWGKYPDKRIDITPSPGVARAYYGDTLIAESDKALLLIETKHVDRLYFPFDAIKWEHFVKSELQTICPFKGRCDYWSLQLGGKIVEEDLVWCYPEVFDEVAPIANHVAFYDERVRIEIDDRWTEQDASLGTTSRFPLWGDAKDLLHLMDVQPTDTPGHFTTPTWRTPRNVVEGGQMLGTALLATAKTIPNERVTYASMIFSKAANFDDPIDLYVDVVKPGRTFSTVEVRMDQNGSHRALGMFLMDGGSPDVIRHQLPMPNVPGPEGAVPHDFRMTGRDLRIIDGAYDPNPDRVGTPEIYAWVKFREAPATQAEHVALFVQSMTHWTIAASMRPHKGFGEALAHVTLATGVMSIGVNIHEPIDITKWYLYHNPSVWAGYGLGVGQCQVYSQDGALVASYTNQVMIRNFNRPPEAMGKDWSNAM